MSGLCVGFDSSSGGCWQDARVMGMLPEISVPCLLLVGERDKQFLSGTEYMAKKIPGAR